MSPQEVFDADLERHNAAFEKAGAVAEGRDAATGETFRYIDRAKAPPALVSSYRLLLQHAAANGLDMHLDRNGEADG